MGQCRMFLFYYSILDGLPSASQPKYEVDANAAVLEILFNLHSTNTVIV